MTDSTFTDFCPFLQSHYCTQLLYLWPVLQQVPHLRTLLRCRPSLTRTTTPRSSNNSSTSATWRSNTQSLRRCRHSKWAPVHRRRTRSRIRSRVCISPLKCISYGAEV
jgi:hypothetical protein